MKKPNSIDEYIATYPDEVQKLLNQIRIAIRKVAPEAEEAISYGIPSFKLNKKGFAYFAAYTKHISFYPAPRTSELFKKELSNYKGGKGTIQFPLDKPLPMPLITKIIKFRRNENMELTKAKSKPQKK